MYVTDVKCHNAPAYGGGHNNYDAMRKKLSLMPASVCPSVCHVRVFNFPTNINPESQKNNGSNIINKLLLQQENIHRHGVPGSQLEEAGAQSFADCRPASVRVNQHVPLLYSRQVTT